jgi:2-polyprenyl-3-methyl-5-hydroxy-6-metoxy-1,4-benzoquinol methylase
MMVLEAIHKSGSFIGIGCANGYLMESLSRWLSGSGLALEFYGLDISMKLLDLAKKRLPGWQNRFYQGNTRTSRHYPE